MSHLSLRRSLAERGAAVMANRESRLQPWLWLPSELAQRIFGTLTMQEKATAERVCKLWRQQLASSQVSAALTKSAACSRSAERAPPPPKVECKRVEQAGELVAVVSFQPAARSYRWSGLVQLLIICHALCAST